jgi:TRAP transporter TAXI family solute receptor
MASTTRHMQRWKDIALIYGPAVVLVVAGFLVARYFIKPAPPGHVSIAAGDPAGAYYAYAQRYGELLAKDGITLNILETSGSVENIDLLRSGKASIGFLQGGTLPADPKLQLEGLGSLYYEPLWLFHKKDRDLDRLDRFASLKVNIGPEGSGTHALVQRLLQENSLKTARVETLGLDNQAAVDALHRGRIDAAFFVAGQGSETIDRLLLSPDLAASSFERAGAYARRFSYLTPLIVPEGAQSLALNIPDRDITLIATTASLAVRPDIHPAIVDLMMQAATEVHAPGGWFEAHGEFPTPRFLELPLNPQAQRFYEHGPPFLQKYLPFWAASLIDRLKVMLLPLAALLLPLLKIMPPVYRWRMNSRVLGLYEVLEKLDRSLSRQPPDQRSELLGQLDELDDKARRLKVPAAYMDRIYQLRQHIELIKGRCAKQ